MSWMAGAAVVWPWRPATARKLLRTMFGQQPSLPTFCRATVWADVVLVRGGSGGLRREGCRVPRDPLVGEGWRGVHGPRV